MKKHKLGNFICKNKFTIVILTLILLVPAFLGMAMTNINYDILVYLPEEIDTVKGQNILADDFNMGAFSVSIIDNMSSKDILKLEKKIKEVEGVVKVVSAYDVIGNTIPLEILSEDVISKFQQGDSSLMLITYDETTSHEKTLEAVDKVKEITKDHAKVSGMSAMVLDTMELSEVEIIIYIAIAVLLCLIILELSLDSYIVPFLLLVNIGIAILFNLGTNIIFGEISYITKALVAVLQLGVTTDFSIFLYHSYENNKKKYKTKEEGMANAISETFMSVVGSSLTTIAGFLVLCTMQLTLGKDLGLVMAKGVFLGVVCVLTVFPSLLLVFDKYIEKTKHKNILPKFNKLNAFVVKHYKKAFVIFLIMFVPVYLANNKVDVYYKLDETLPKNLDSIVANNEVKEKFNIVSPEIILVNKDMKASTLNNMILEIENIEGIDFVLSFSKLASQGISEDMLSDDVKKIFQSNKYQMILINSVYDIATNELNNQVLEVERVMNKYTKDGLLAGEGPLMKDLVNISDTDFKNVNASSIICILIIMVFVLKSFSLPILLISVIEFAIFLNMSIPYFSGTSLPFVAPIVLGTIQLGATIDYAILMTSTYFKNRKNNDKFKAIENTLNSCVSSIIVSGLCFFGATFGVGAYSELEMISSLCTLISRGAIISMMVVIIILPAVLIIFDKIICKTTIGFNRKKDNMKNNVKKNVAMLMLGVMVFSVFNMPVQALSKDETVFAKLNYDGSVKSISVQDHLINDDKLEKIEDETELEDIFNTNGDEEYVKDGKKIIWKAMGKDIFYQGKTEKELPINMSVEYYLDGEKHTLDDMLGKSGKVTIKLKYQNVDKHMVNVNGKKTALYTPFVVSAITMINAENNSNISVNNGKIINNGLKSIVVGMAMPGLDKNLNEKSLNKFNNIEITYETEKFELASIYNIATPKVISSDDLKVLDNLNYVYNDVNKLGSSIKEIESGAKKLVDGASTLNNGSSLIYENLVKVNKSMEELKKGTVAVDNGLSQILNSLNDTKKLINGNSNEGVNSIKSLISTNNNTINTLSSTNASLSATYQKYNLATLDYATIININEDLVSVKVMYENSYESNLKMIELLRGNNKALSETLKVLESTSKQVNTLINTVEKYLLEIKSGTSKLVSGSKSLSSGVNTLTIKTKDLVSGTKTLNNGIKDLNDGIIKYDKDGISKLVSLVNNDVKSMENRIRALVKLGEDYEAFSGNNEQDAISKFVMVVNSKEVPVVKTDVIKPKEEDNFWSRLKNLFK